MRKNITILFVILVLALTACGTSANATETDTSTQTDPTAQTISVANLLLLGTLKLDGTEQAVTPAQAKELLPLWQVYQEISTSDTAAQAEIEALEKQIQETLTADQMKAIQAMNLTPQDIITLMQERGLRQRSASSSNSGNNAGFIPGQGRQAGESGGFPGGGQMIPGGQMPDGGDGFNPEQMATAQASRSGTGRSATMMTSALLNALIQYLQQLAGT